MEIANAGTWMSESASLIGCDSVLFIPSFVFAALKRNSKTLDALFDLTTIRQVLTPIEMASLILINREDVLGLDRDGKANHDTYPARLFDFGYHGHFNDKNAYEYLEHVIKPLISSGNAKTHLDMNCKELAGYGAGSVIMEYGDSTGDETPSAQTLNPPFGFVACIKINDIEDIRRNEQTAANLCKTIVGKYYSRCGYSGVINTVYYDLYKDKFLDR